jgi:hypothetical protein
MAGRIKAWFRHILDVLLDRKKTCRRHLLDFFECDICELQTHEKCFPGYDIASLNRALMSLLEETCTYRSVVGACNQGAQTLRQVFDSPYFLDNVPPPPLYERVPVGVDEEESLVVNGLYLAVMRLHKGEATHTFHRIAVYLASTIFGHDYWDSPAVQNVPAQQIKLSIACHSRQVADRFFAEIEERRKRLSIFRGKVIDPVVGAGGIRTVGFRAMHDVRDEDLILPDDVKALVRSSILGFYQHTDMLRKLGIDLKRGILFHGPPGTGKTSLSMFLARELPHFTVCFASGERLLYPRELCRMARYLQPAMIVFEDIDLVAQDRNANGLATVLGELMNQIDGCEPTDQVLFIMNTNSLERLEHAVRNRPGRADQIIEIPLPDYQERELLLQRFARTLRLEDEDLSEFVEATAGTTPALMKEIVKRAAVSAVERTAAGGNGKPVILGKGDLMLALAQVRALREPECVAGNFGFRSSHA